MSQHPTGRFTAIAQKAEVGESTKKGTPGVFFTFKTSEGEIDGSLWLSDRAYERTLNTLRECFGFNDDFASLGAQVEGRECSVNAVKSANWTCVGLCAHESALAGGKIVKLPAFTQG